MSIDFFDSEKSKIDMVDYIGKTIENYTENITGTAPTPADEAFFLLENVSPYQNTRLPNSTLLLIRAY